MPRPQFVFISGARASTSTHPTIEQFFPSIEENVYFKKNQDRIENSLTYSLTYRYALPPFFKKINQIANKPAGIVAAF